MVEPGRVRFSHEYVQCVSSDEVREYLVKSGIPRVDGYFENGPSGAHERELTEGDSKSLYLGDGGDPEGSSISTARAELCDIKFRIVLSSSTLRPDSLRSRCRPTWMSPMASWPVTTTLSRNG
jgi:hypothetical protein